jgi:hypothetical protein
MCETIRSYTFNRIGDRNLDFGSEIADHYGARPIQECELFGSEMPALRMDRDADQIAVVEGLWVDKFDRDWQHEVL